MPQIGNVQYGSLDNASSGYDFGFADALDKVQQSVFIPGGSADDKKGYTLDNHPSYTPDQTLDAQYRNSYDYKPEHRVRRSKYADPFIPNFKLLIDFDKPYGLFANEKYPNSALAYVKRVFGENSPRHLMLLAFIEQFKLFIKEYDFLILNVDNLEELYGIYNKHTYVEESEIKCNVTIRETVTMHLMGLINMYHNIWFDEIRGVEVIPENLRRFDLYIMIYSAGYFNSMLYDLQNPVDGSINPSDDAELFPTVYKLETLRQLNKWNFANVEFNTFVFHLIDAQINVAESGNKMFGEISNEMSSDYVKNNLSFTARFINLRGKFAQYDSGIDLFSLLAIENRSKNNGNQSYFKGYATRAYKALKKTGIDIINNATSSVFGALKGLVAPTSPIGNALQLLASPEEIAKKFGNALSVPINGVINKYIDQPANWLQSMVESNFRSDILTDLMHGATDKFFGTAVDQRREIENINDIAKNLVTSTDVKPQSYDVIIPKEQKGVARTLNYQQNISEYLPADNKTNIEHKPEIPEYQETNNASNIEVKETISEYQTTDNKTNIEHKPEIPEYQETNNASNIEVKETISEYQTTDNKTNIEHKPEIPEYQKTNNASNIEVKETISEYQTTDNKTNIEHKPEIPEYVNSRNQTNLTYEELIQIFKPVDSKTNIEVKPEIPEYQETNNASNIEVKETISEYKETENKNNLEVKPEIPEYNSPENNNNIEVKETISEYVVIENKNNIEYQPIINTDSDTDSTKPNIDIQQPIDEYPNSTDTKKLSINTVTVNDSIDNYPDSTDTKKLTINTVSVENPIDSYPFTESAQDTKNINNPEYKKKINPNAD